MGEWWSYRLEDLTLFSPRAYYRLIESYNRSIWPAQLIAICVAAALFILVVGRSARERGRLVALILSAAWLWVAWGFLLERYAAIHWAAKWFALGFAIEGAALLAVGVVAGGLRFDGGYGTSFTAGLVVALFALVVLPLIGPVLGRSIDSVELFGLMPDPTAIATLGVLLLASSRVRWPLLVIPVAWSLVSGATLLSIDAADAMTAPIAGAAALLFAIRKSIMLRHGANELELDDES